MIKKEVIKKYYQDYKNYVLNEIFDKDLEHADKLSKTNYLIYNNNNKSIEAEYFFRQKGDDTNLLMASKQLYYWDLSWGFTNNNKDKSSEAWKQVIATSYKVLYDFVKENDPKIITFSGDTSEKTNIYKSESYLKKLRELFNDKYSIKVDDFKVILIDKQITASNNIVERIITLNESYRESALYWLKGDKYSKSRIERWDTIKNQIKRIVIKELYIRK